MAQNLGAASAAQFPPTPPEKFNRQEKKAIGFLSGLMFFRMFGVFVVLPIFSVYALQMPLATPFLVGLAYGGYALTQAFLQIPFGILSDVWTRKKALILGFSLFAGGCLVSALANNIYWMLLGRLLQGTGAVSSTLIAFLADNVRDQFQTRAMAFIGLSIGLSFGLAFFMAPLLAYFIHIQGIFLVLSIISLGIVLVLIFQKEPTLVKKPTKLRFQDLFLFLIKYPIALPVCTNFLISFGLAVFLFNLPLLLLHQFSWQGAELWKFYLPMLILGGVAMVPASILAEKYKRFRTVYFVGISCILVAALVFILGLFALGVTITVGLLAFTSYLFFIGFNIFEPLLPSLAVKNSPEHQKGLGSGILSFFQFLGQFFGAFAAGLFQGPSTYIAFLLLLLIACAIMVWTGFSRSFQHL